MTWTRPATSSAHLPISASARHTERADRTCPGDRPTAACADRFALVVEDRRYSVSCSVRKDSSVLVASRKGPGWCHGRAPCPSRRARPRGIVEYPNSECGFEQRLAARDHAYRVHDVSAFDLFEHVAGRARQD